MVTPNVRPASPRQQQLPVQVHDELALTVHAVYARLIASERVGGLKYGAHYCWRTTGHSTCATNKSEAAAAAVPKVHDELALTVHAVYARPKASERVGGLKYESTIDCERLVMPRVRPRSPRQQQLPSQVPAELALGFTRCTLSRRRASACVGSSMESTIDCGQLVTPNGRLASPGQQQLPVQVPEVGTYSSRGVRSADCERARGWAQVRSPLLFADDWARHVCGQQVRGSSSCYSKCTMNWHLQFTRCTLG